MIGVIDNVAVEPGIKPLDLIVSAPLPGSGRRACGEEQNSDYPGRP
jgi:hypothetical protein